METITLPGYRAVSSLAENGHGIATLIAKKCAFQEHDLRLGNTKLEASLVEIIPNSWLKNSVYVMNVYCSPRDNRQTFYSLTTKASSKNRRSYSLELWGLFLLKAGVPVYKKGEPCSACGSDFECDVTKLCVEKVKISTSGESRIDGAPSLLAIVGIGAAVIICVVVVICLVVVHTRRRRTGTGAAAAAQLTADGSNEAAAGDAAGAEDHKMSEAEKTADGADHEDAAASHEALAKK
ncbi:uncharacterized protein LOC119448665 [Dermacentor silvarum]|uniref:uncharacterized protein LOC119448665 n=1 Tax=Dermacentor silvarum TaxID=543639 RepID=UPI001897FC79|nr:uncharacterized protein LOC119448665 [Dermacentor silvarum]